MHEVRDLSEVYAGCFHCVCLRVSASEVSCVPQCYWGRVRGSSGRSGLPFSPQYPSRFFPYAQSLTSIGIMMWVYSPSFPDLKTPGLDWELVESESVSALTALRKSLR